MVHALSNIMYCIQLIVWGGGVVGVVMGSRDLISDVISFISSQSAGMQLCCSSGEVNMSIADIARYTYMIPLVLFSVAQCLSVQLFVHCLKGQRSQGGVWCFAEPEVHPVVKPHPPVPHGCLENRAVVMAMVRERGIQERVRCARHELPLIQSCPSSSVTRSSRGWPLPPATPTCGCVGGSSPAASDFPPFLPPVLAPLPPFPPEDPDRRPDIAVLFWRVGLPFPLSSFFFPFTPPLPDLSRLAPEELETEMM